MAEEKPTPPTSPKGELIASLLSSGDAWVKLLTLGLILFTGTGNWFATQNNGATSHADFVQMRSEITQFFNNQKTYLQSLQSLQQNNEDTRWIKDTLLKNGEISRQNNVIARSASEEIHTLRDELEKLKAELRKPIEQRNFQ